MPRLSGTPVTLPTLREDMTALRTSVLGDTGADVTKLGFGAMELRANMGEDAVARLLNAVLDAGITMIDTSPDYGLSEEFIGAGIAHRRDEYFLASKCGCQVEPPPPPDRFPDHTFTRVRTSGPASSRACAACGPTISIWCRSISARHGRSSRKTTPSPSCSRCGTRARCASSGCREPSRTSSSTSRWVSSRCSRSRTRRSNESTSSSSRTRPKPAPGRSSAAGSLARSRRAARALLPVVRGDALEARALTARTPDTVAGGRAQPR